MSKIARMMQQATAGAGSAGLDVDEVFSTFLYDGNSATQVIENGIALGNANDGGSIRIPLNSSLESLSHSFAYGTADFTVEFFMWINSVPNQANVLDHRPTGASSTGFFVGFTSGRYLRFNQGSTDHIIDSGQVNLGQWYHIAVSRASGTTKMFKDGTQVGSNYSDTNNYTSSTLEIGQRSTSNGNPFDGWVTDVRIVLGTALYTSNFTSPTAALTAVSGTELLIGGGDTPLVDQSSNSISFTQVANPVASEFGRFTGTSGEGGLVWIKGRTGTPDHVLYDTERGANSLRLSSNTTNAAVTASGYDFTSFNSNGFTVKAGALYNYTNDNRPYVSWTWRKQPKFFDVVTYTGDGTSNRAIAHNLGTTPGMVIVKRTSISGSWIVSHNSIGSTDYLNLNATNAKATNSTFFPQAHTSTHFYVGNDGDVNDAPFYGTNRTYVAYLFAHNNNDGEFGPNADQDIIKCGSYTGNGSSTGPVIDLGFEPQFVMVKNSSDTGGWQVMDTTRGMPVGNDDARLQWNTTDAETDPNFVDPQPTGFQVTSTGSNMNTNGATYIYMAIRRGPLAAPTDATKVFAIDAGENSSDPRFTSNFPVDFAYISYTTGGSHYSSARLIQGKELLFDSGNAEGSGSNYSFDFNNGWVAGSVGNNAISYMWKRAPSYFDVTAWTGTGSDMNISHNLGVVPEMIWARPRSYADNWSVFHKDTTYDLKLNGSDAEGTGTAFGTPTSSVIPVTGGLRASSQTYIAFLFATVAGVSKVGSYTGNGGTQTIDCGFSNGARFVLVKPTSATGHWAVFDTERGIVAGNDPYLLLNANNAQTEDFDELDPNSSGFAVNHVAGIANVNGVSYIFYAIA